MDNDYVKFGLFFLGGVALGALGAVAVTKGDVKIKPLVADALSRGLEIKDALLAKVETVKEDVDDMVAEARQAAEDRKVAAEDTVA